MLKSVLLAVLYGEKGPGAKLKKVLIMKAQIIKKHKILTDKVQINIDTIKIKIEKII